MENILIIDLDKLPDSALLRERQLCPKPPLHAAILPFSAPTLWRKVKLGEFPEPDYRAQGVTAWRAGSIKRYLAASKAAAQGEFERRAPARERRIAGVKAARAAKAKPKAKRRHLRVEARPE